MSTRQRFRDGETPGVSDGAPDAAAERRARVAAADRLVAEADTAIDQCLSEDSDLYLRSNRQRGGQ